jgi:type I restriction enzyme S subunit
LIVDAGTNLLSLPNISKDGRLILDEVPFTENSDASLLLEPGDLLFNWRNGSTEHLGKTVRFNLPGNWTHVSFLLRVRATEDSACTSFLRYFLNGMRETGFFASAKAGVNNTFNLFELRNLVIAAPPTRAEQEQISMKIEYDISKIDATSEILDQSVTALLDYRSNLITAAVTGRLESLNGD